MFAETLLMPSSAALIAELGVVVSLLSVSLVYSTREATDKSVCILLCRAALALLPSLTGVQVQSRFNFAEFIQYYLQAHLCLDLSSQRSECHPTRI